MIIIIDDEITSAVHIRAKEWERFVGIRKIYAITTLHVNPFSVQICSCKIKAELFQERDQSVLFFKYSDVDFVPAKSQPMPKRQTDCTFSKTLMPATFINFNCADFETKLVRQSSFSKRYCFGLWLQANESCNTLLILIYKCFFVFTCFTMEPLHKSGTIF